MEEEPARAVAQAHGEIEPTRGALEPRRSGRGGRLPAQRVAQIGP